ncbi:GumC family protein [Arvimicrobium flavum]|uniref:GumC family protein n=1 Tax=Arvimicrobium flavum TaxID=3393320 RepID=UPI00237A894C|nr:Wzz/FepE/Etk N-terminal domain-containing protein [Mesorhizobium shangrilense]
MDKQYTASPLIETDASLEGHPSRRNSGVIGVREVVSLFIRRSYFIGGFVLLSCIVLIIAVLAMDDTYTASATLVLERREGQLMETVTELTSEERDRSAIETEMDIIKSRVFAGKVVDATNLMEHPWFNTYLAGERDADSPGSAVGHLVGKVKSALLGFFGWDETGGARKLPSKSVQWDRAVTSLLANTDVTRSGDSFAVTVRVSTPDPELSATLANTAANIYVEWSLELRKKSMSDAVNFLRERANRVASRIASNERAITDFRRLNELASSERDDIVRKRLEDMGSQLTTARGELAATRARREQGERAIAEARDFEGTSLDSPLLATLRGERAVLMRQRAQYSSNFAAGHPQIAQTDAQLVSVASMLDTEVRRIVDDLKSEEKVVSDRAQQLESQISELQTTLQQRSLAEIRLRELERDLLADQKLHDLVVARLGGLDPFAEIAKPSARVVSVAAVPTSPSFPQRKRILAAGGAAATVLAMIVAVMLEAGDSRIRSGQRITEIVRLRNLANIPKVRRSLLGGDPHMLERLVDKPRSTIAEAFRSLFLVCRSQVSNAKGVIVITSPLPKEGATSVAWGLAFAAANDGLKTLYMSLDPEAAAPTLRAMDDDAELSFIPERLEVPEADGVIRPVAEVNRLDALVSPGAAADGETYHTMTWSDATLLLAKLRSSYDLIVIDAAPVLIVEDANWLSPLADAVLLVVRFGHTTEQELAAAVSRLNMNQAPLIGTVLNCVDPRGRKPFEPLGAASYPRQAKAYLRD